MSCVLLSQERLWEFLVCPFSYIFPNLQRTGLHSTMVDMESWAQDAHLKAFQRSLTEHMNSPCCVEILSLKKMQMARAH